MTPTSWRITSPDGHVSFSLTEPVVEAGYQVMALCAVAERDRLISALMEFRSLIHEGGVPRYTVAPSAAFNSFVEQTLDPLLARLAATKGAR